MPESAEQHREALLREAREGLRHLRSPRKQQILRELVDDLEDRGGAAVDWKLLRQRLQREESMRALRSLWAPALLAIFVIHQAQCWLPSMNAEGSLYRGSLWFVIYAAASALGAWGSLSLGGLRREAARVAMMYALVQTSAMAIGAAYGLCVEACGRRWWAASYFALEGVRMALAQWGIWIACGSLTLLLAFARLRRDALLGAWSLIAWAMLGMLCESFIFSMQAGAECRYVWAHSLAKTSGVFGVMHETLAPMIAGGALGLGVALLARRGSARMEATHA